MKINTENAILECLRIMECKLIDMFSTPSFNNEKVLKNKQC